MGHAENKTLRVACASCGASITTYVDPDSSRRETWPLLGEYKGEKTVFPICKKCHERGWQPPGFQQ